MALYIKDPEVDRMADRLAVLHRVSKTEAVKQALRHELEREQALPTLVERGVTFVRSLHASANLADAKLADKAFIDSLYDNS